MIHWVGGYSIGYIDLDSMFDVYSDCYWDYELMNSLLLYPVWVDEMLISSKWDCLLISVQTWYVSFHATENHWESIARP